MIRDNKLIVGQIGEINIRPEYIAKPNQSA